MDQGPLARTPFGPLPRDIAAGEFGTGLFYEKYAAFTWSWSWRRTLLFAMAAVPFGALLGVIHGLYVHSWAEGWAVGWRAGGANLLTVGLGPCLAAFVRQGGLTWRIERAFVIGSVLLGMVAGLAAGAYAIAFHDRIMMQPFTGTAALLDLFSAGLPPAHVLVSRAADMIARLGLYAVCGGALGLRTYLGEPRRWREHEERLALEAARQGRLEAERRLALLQAQVEPHFLFNTLASVRSLIQSEPHRAAEMIDALAVYLRSTLPRLREGASAPESTLRAQFEICKTFLALMDLRLGGRLTVSTDLPEALAALPFPPSLLISLVENAVRHGVEPKVGPSRIELAARQYERVGVPTLEVAVQDDGAGLSEGPVEGTGLANVRGQLHTLYGAAGRLSIESRALGGARAEISIPIGALTA